MKKPFQTRVKDWMQACFGAKISADKIERGDRLLEEIYELLQSGDYPRERVRALEAYVWDRPKGDPTQESGGVSVTHAAYCLAHGINMEVAAEAELARIWTKVDKIRAKQAAKPTGSALPVARSLFAEVPPFAVRHKKRGTIYSIIGYGNIQTENPLHDYDDVVIYSDSHGVKWIRPIKEFEDGRFEMITGETS
jgi:hypothetical protein